MSLQESQRSFMTNCMIPQEKKKCILKRPVYLYFTFVTSVKFEALSVCLIVSVYIYFGLCTFLRKITCILRGNSNNCYNAFYFVCVCARYPCKVISFSFLVVRWYYFTIKHRIWPWDVYRPGCTDNLWQGSRLWRGFNIILCLLESIPLWTVYMYFCTQTEQCLCSRYRKTASVLIHFCGLDTFFCFDI